MGGGVHDSYTFQCAVDWWDLLLAPGSFSEFRLKLCTISVTCVKKIKMGNLYHNWPILFHTFSHKF